MLPGANPAYGERGGGGRIRRGATPAYDGGSNQPTDREGCANRVAGQARPKAARIVYTAGLWLPGGAF